MQGVSAWFRRLPVEAMLAAGLPSPSLFSRFEGACLAIVAVPILRAGFGGTSLTGPGRPGRVVGRRTSKSGPARTPSGRS